MTTERATLNRRTLLMGGAAAVGTAILAACGGNSATSAPAATTAATKAASTTGSAATTAATTAGGAATTAATAAGGAATTAATTAGGAATTAAPTTAAGGAATSAGGAATRPAGSAVATSGSTTTGSAPAGTVTTASGTTAGVNPVGPMACVDGSIVSLGSTALQPLIEAAAKAYSTKCGNAKINVQGGGSGTGLTQVFSGGATIGNSDIFAEEREGIDPKMVVDHQVVVQGFAMAANPMINVASLTGDQVVAIFTGKTTNWKDVGGPDTKIAVINRPASSGTRATFKKYALKNQSEAQGIALTEDSSGAVAQAIKDTPGAIGYLGLAYFQQNRDLKVVNFNGKAPTVENISDDSYPIWSYGHMYSKGEATGLAKAFIDYILSDDIQTTLVPQLGYIPATKVKAKHTP